MEKTIELTKKYLLEKNMPKSELAIRLGYERSTISKILSGKYTGDKKEVIKKLQQFLEEEGVMQLSEQSTTKPSYTDFIKRKSFFETADSKGVIGVCSSCQNDMGLGIIVGKSGYGKTYTLKYYAKMNRVAYIECDDTMSSRDLVEAIERSLGIPQTYGTIWKRVNGIRDFFTINEGYLLIIDEADKLISKYTQKKMEILRAIFDQSDVGMVIAGEPKLESQIKSYLTRFANRVDFYTCFKGLTRKEVETYLKDYEVEDEAMEELVHRANGNQTGCFRLLDRTLRNVFRIMNEQELRVITPEVIKEASNMMML